MCIFAGSGELGLYKDSIIEINQVVWWKGYSDNYKLIQEIIWRSNAIKAGGYSIKPWLTYICLKKWTTIICEPYKEKKQ